VTAEALERHLIEDLGNESKLLVDDYYLAVRDRYARGLLSPVLQRRQRVVREPSDVLTWGVDPDDAAGVPNFLAHGGRVSDGEC
jgi:hypothetical protein